jgi:hypothetical protein
MGSSVQFREGKKSLVPRETTYSVLLMTSRPDGVGKDEGGGEDGDNLKKCTARVYIHVVI